MNDNDPSFKQQQPSPSGGYPLLILTELLLQQLKIIFTHLFINRERLMTALQQILEIIYQQYRLQIENMVQLLVEGLEQMKAVAAGVTWYQWVGMAVQLLTLGWQAANVIG